MVLVRLKQTVAEVVQGDQVTTNNDTKPAIVIDPSVFPRWV